MEEWLKLARKIKKRKGKNKRAAKRLRVEMFRHHMLRTIFSEMIDGCLNERVWVLMSESDSQAVQKRLLEEDRLETVYSGNSLVFEFNNNVVRDKEGPSK